MDIDVATLVDFPAVSAFLQDCELSATVIPDHMDDCLLLRSGRTLIGVVMFRCMGNVALGLGMAVRSGFRGRGLGKRLGSAMLEHCRNRGVNIFYVYSDQASFYFRSLGFHTAEACALPPQAKEALECLHEGAALDESYLLEMRLGKVTIPQV